MTAAKNQELSIDEQDAIAEAGRKEAINGGSWKENPYPAETEEHKIWHGGYEIGAEEVGSAGKDW